VKAGALLQLEESAHQNRLLGLVLLALERRGVSGRPSNQPVAAHYQRNFDIVELNAPFYPWPRLTIVIWTRGSASLPRIGRAERRTSLAHSQDDCF
jgi:hypothetical protein